MIEKGSACDGCPFRHKGRYFTPDKVVQGSRVYFLAQNPGASEEAGRLLLKREWMYGHSHDEYTQVQPQPLIGATGKLFTERFLSLSGLPRDVVSTGNVIRCRPGASLSLKPDALPSLTTAMKLETSSADIVKAMKHCQNAYFHPPSSTEVVVTMGRYAMFALTGIQSEENEFRKKLGVMESWRGYGVDVADFRTPHTVDTSYYHDLSSTKRVYFTQHLAALFQGELDSSSTGLQGQGGKKYYHATLEDYNRLRLLLEGKWPEPLPTWSTTPPKVWPNYAAFDTEYVPETNQLLRWSLCDTNGNLYGIEYDPERSLTLPLLPKSTILAQNWIADYGHFLRLVGSDAVRTALLNLEDMFLAHTVLWTGEPHNLNYIQSKYGTVNRYKHLISSDDPETQTLYSVLDAHQPMTMWLKHFLPQFREDPLSWQVYRKYRVKLIEPYWRAEQAGSAVDTARLSDVKAILEERLQGYRDRAREITGDVKLNLGGRKAMLEYVYGT
jgi:uracil-DNA glycosylase